MAALTWRNIDTPNLAPAIQGYQQFSQLLGQAFGGATTALNTFDESKTDKASNEFMQNLLTRYSGTPDEFQADLQSGKIFEGVDRNRINADALGLLARRGEDLQRYAAGTVQLEDARQDLTQQGLENAWKGSDRAAIDAAKPQISRIMAAASSDNPEASMAQLYADPAFASAIGGLDPAMQVALGKAGPEQIQALLGLTTTRNQHRAQGDQHQAAVFDQERNQWTFNNEKIDRQTEEIGMAISNGVLAGSTDAASALLNLEGSEAFQRASPRAQSVARAMVQQQFGDLYAAPAEALTQAASGSSDFTFAAPQQSVASTLKSGGLSDAVVAGFLGNFHVEGGYGGATGDNGSAAGIAQWRGERRENFRKRFGVDPTRGTPEQQAQFVLWELNNPAAAGMTRAQADRIRNARTAEEAAVLIDQNYERSSGEHRSRRVAAARAAHASTTNPRTSAAVTSAQVNNNSGNSRWFANLTDESNAPEVARSLRGTADEPGPLRNVPEAWISEQTRDIVRRGTRNGVQHITYAEAGRILADTTNRQQRSVLDRALSLDFSDTNLGNGYSTDNDAINARIQEAVRGVPQQRREALETVQASAAAIETARANVSNAQAALTRMMNSGRPGVVQSSAYVAAQARLAAARQNLAMVEGSARPNITPVVVQPGEEPGILDTLINAFRPVRQNGR